MERGQQRVTKMIKGLEPVSYEERLKGAAQCEKKAQGETQNVYKYLKGGSEEHGNKFWTSCLKDKRQ